MVHTSPILLCSDMRHCDLCWSYPWPPLIGHCQCPYVSRFDHSEASQLIPSNYIPPGLDSVNIPTWPLIVYGVTFYYLIWHFTTWCLWHSSILRLLNLFPLEIFDSMNTGLHCVLKENVKFNSIAPTQIRLRPLLCCVMSLTSGSCDFSVSL